MAKKMNLEEELEQFYEEKIPVLMRRPAGAPIGSSHTVTVNGKNYQIMYDEEVMVPRNVKLIIEEKEKNEKLAELRMAQYAGKIQNLDGE